MDTLTEKVIDNMDSAIYSGEGLTFNLEALKYFKDILDRWMKKVDENIKYLEENNA